MTAQLGDPERWLPRLAVPRQPGLGQDGLPAVAALGHYADMGTYIDVSAFNGQATDPARNPFFFWLRVLGKAAAGIGRGPAQKLARLARLPHPADGDSVRFALPASAYALARPILGLMLARPTQTHHQLYRAPTGQPTVAQDQDDAVPDPAAKLGAHGPRAPGVRGSWCRRSGSLVQVLPNP